VKRVSTSLDDVCSASVPLHSLPALAAIRNRPGVTVALHQGRAYLRWHAGDEPVLRALLPIAGVQTYVKCDDHWHRFGRHLPSFDYPSDAEYRPLHMALTPLPLHPLPPSVGAQPADRPALTLVPDARPRPAFALLCGLQELARWADTVPDGRLQMLQAARREDRVLILGSPLPPLPRAERLWGKTVLAPLGFRLDPALPDSTIRAALGIADDELLLVTAGGVEAIESAALHTLGRAQVRLALEGSAS
jgi:hypothetical protein